MPTIVDAQNITKAVTQIVKRVRKEFPDDGTWSVDKEQAILRAVCADDEMKGLLRDGTNRDAMALAFIEAIVSADLDSLFSADAAE